MRIRIITISVAISAALLGTALLGTAAAQGLGRGAHAISAGAQVMSAEAIAHVAVSGSTTPPIGWVEFCNEHRHECVTASSEPRDVVLTPKNWKDLVRINRNINETIKPVTDLEHWGVIERWSYPDDGQGDCEDYVLLKRRTLIEAGWPREALLITVVRDHKGDGHAVLTVKTDRGDFILDNQVADILLWSETGYRFVKRQSQSNPNHWVALGDTRPSVATAAAR
jgi:predicted transglutaminase-like cysteine proteinase